MFGLEPSLSAKKALDLFKKNKFRNVIELGAGLGRDTIFFGQNSINITAVDYSEKGVKIIDEKVTKNKLKSNITTLQFDIRKKLPFDDNSIDACYSHMLYCMALTSEELLN